MSTFHLLMVRPSVPVSSHMILFHCHFSKIYAVAESLGFIQPQAYSSKIETPRLMLANVFQSYPVIVLEI